MFLLDENGRVWAHVTPRRDTGFPTDSDIEEMLRAYKPENDPQVRAILAAIGQAEKEEKP
jgi:hypothetical protein